MPPKACNACADSKRRCDKQLPECQRCLDRDVDCVYPQPKRRRRDRAGHIVRDGGYVEELPSTPQQQNYAGSDALGDGGFDLWGWDAMGGGAAADLDIPLSADAIFPFIPAMPGDYNTAHATPPLTASAQEAGRESGGGGVGGSIFSPAPPSPTTTPSSSSSRPWFLQDETWAIQRSSMHQEDCLSTCGPQPFIQAVEEMLRCWVRTGHNGFVHHRLYEKGMPVCVQDAFTTLAAYTGRTPAVAETILQIAEERACALVGAQTGGGDTQGLRAHLARVHALFVYEFIRLFDGSVRLRASAERQLPTLRRWVGQMREAAQQYHGGEVEEEERRGGEDDGEPPVGRHHRRQLRWDAAASEFNREYEASAEMWRLWVLTESVRRTHLIVDVIANTYQTMSQGWAECTGAVMFTARCGLWDAGSAGEWFDLCCAKSSPPLLVPALQPYSMIAQYAAEEFDDFVTLFWTFLVGADKIRYWQNRGGKRQLDHNLS
ncbi:hypothetical protein SLS62_001058 [Diatrype stigma]|uniref:Zn(2)-C6 fungal-type domain-containing protein n=1 Tax=Diatrype stigma TaxID=117547 RepID=A0AAN9V268_9PEZI